MLLLGVIASLLALFFKLPDIVAVVADAVVVVVVLEGVEADVVEVLVDFLPAGFSTLASSGKSSSKLGFDFDAPLAIFVDVVVVVALDAVDVADVALDDDGVLVSAVPVAGFFFSA